MKSRILLTGKNGQVGSELAHYLPAIGDAIALGRAELDIAKPDEIRRVIGQSRPQVIINAAAYTAVDQAEKEEHLAQAINADAPAIIAEEAKKYGALVVHYGTDYVFDGTKRSPYTESDPTNPLNVYGRTKLAGEEAIRSSGAAHIILRTSWVYATLGKNFFLTILRLAATRDELRIVKDQFGAPTTAREIARATARVVHLAMAANASARPAPNLASAVGTGTYHLTAAGETTWHDFAVAILDECSRLPPDTPWLAAATAGRPLVAKRIIPITTADYPTPVRRPAYSVLSNAHFVEKFAFALPDWRSQLAALVRSDPQHVASSP